MKPTFHVTIKLQMRQKLVLIKCKGAAGEPKLNEG